MLTLYARLFMDANSDSIASFYNPGHIGSTSSIFCSSEIEAEPSTEDSSQSFCQGMACAVALAQLTALFWHMLYADTY